MPSYDDPTVHYVQDFLGQLKKVNGFLLMLGDSTMLQFKRGVECEIQRTSDSSKSKNKHSDELYKYQSLQILNDFQFLTSTLESLLKVNKIKILFIVISMGLHYNLNPDMKHGQQVRNNSKVNFEEDIKVLLLKLVSITESDSYGKASIIILWMETFPQHFDTNNGYALTADRKVVKTNCCPIKNDTAEADWRNDITLSHIQSINSSNMHVIQTRDSLKYLDKEHQDGNFRDCTHYCWFPMLFQYQFMQIHDVIKSSIKG
jgi:hypothetical protein